jgi:hypothetical protein
MNTPTVGIIVCFLLLSLTSITSLFAEKRILLGTEEAVIQHGCYERNFDKLHKTNPKIELTSIKAESYDRDHFKGHSIKIGAIYFNPSETSFKEIYGSGFGIGGEVNFNIWRSFDIWFIGSHYSSEGTLPYTQEKTTMNLFTFGGGLKLRLPKGSVNPYLGLGLLAHNYKEENPIGVAESTDIGYISQLGCYFQISGALILDFALNYIHCVVKPQSIEANLGGLQAALRIGFTF